ncbi:MAG: MerR family transcriptional regulator [Lachnospiraceae bacterium]|nr:MerR family transcriptional regulator [Lachnospiraceae bacterium]
MNKKDTFYIGELSKIFDISVDTIRYYEKMGLLHPSRNPQNGYRCYSLTDFQTLILIRELMSLGFHSDQIRDFVSDRTVDSTLHMLEQEINRVNESILELYEKKHNIETRLTSLRNILSESEFEKVILEEKEKRPAVMITDDNLPDDYVDYYIAKFMKQTNKQLNTIGYSNCYTLDLSNSNPDSDYLRTKNIFFLGNLFSLEYNYSLPAGYYLCIFYRGSLKKTKQLVPKLYQYAKRHKLRVIGDPIEMCHIDDYETSKEEEFLIEVELPVEN